MKTALRTPEQLLAYRPLKDVLAAKPHAVHAAAPGDSVYSALERMAEHGIGFLVVLDGDGRLVGVLSERDYARKVILRDRGSRDTLVRDIMTTNVVTVSQDQTIPRCMALMSQHGIRHLPVVDGGKVIAVLSVRDALKAVVEHHERCIRDLELERMTTFNPNASSY